MRFGERLRYVIDVPAGLLSHGVPPHAIQTLVENSVKYAVGPRKEGAEIEVRAAAGSGAPHPRDLRRRSWVRTWPLSGGPRPGEPGSATAGELRCRRAPRGAAPPASRAAGAHGGPSQSSAQTHPPWRFLMSGLLRAYLVDDEPLALKKLTRLLEATGRVEILGSTTDPVAALAFLTRAAGQPPPVDVLFLDIEMPELSGFELVGRLAPQPMIVFTTAYSQYALKAFEISSVDYLMKPIDAAALDRALGKARALSRSERTLAPRAAREADRRAGRPRHPRRTRRPSGSPRGWGTASSSSS